VEHEGAVLLAKLVDEGYGRFGGDYLKNIHKD
jgi:hypothetical protein